MKEIRDYNKILKFTRGILIFIPLLILLFVLNKRFVPFGVLSETYSFKNPAVVISALTPKDNVEDSEKNIVTGEFYQRVSKDPVYFTVDLPFDANFVDVEMEYQNPQAPIVQFGSLRNNKSGNNFLIEPIENKIIENSKLIRMDDKKNDIIFLQKPKDQVSENQEKQNNITQYANFEDFKKNLPFGKTIGFYQYDPWQLYRIENYEPSKTKTILEKALRGSHELVTYIENENLDFAFDFLERNEIMQLDDITIKVYHGNKLVKVFESEKNNKLQLNEKTIKVFLEKPEQGIYFLKIDTGGNTQIKKITTTQKYFAFKNKISLDNPMESSKFYSNSPTMLFKTGHTTGFQTIGVNEEKLILDQINTYFGAQPSVEVKEVIIPKGDVIWEYDGLATITTDSLEQLTPNFQMVVLEENPQIDPKTLDFIIARQYKPALDKNGWKSFKKRFRVEDLLIDKEKIKFIISAPGLSNFDNIKVGLIKVTLRK